MPRCEEEHANRREYAMKRWNVCDASWILLGVTIILVSLVPAFHRTPWQVALSLGEGWATMLTASACVLPLLLVWGRLMRSNPSMNKLETRPFMLALLPYMLLITGLLVSRLFSPATIWFQTHGVLVYPAFKIHLALLDSPGLWLLLAVLVHLPLLLLQRVRLIRVHRKTWWRFLPAILAIANVLSIVALMQDSGMIETLGRFVAMGGKNAVWVVSLVGAVEEWLTSSLWSRGIIVV
jgi:hypothetical protein